MKSTFASLAPDLSGETLTTGVVKGIGGGAVMIDTGEGVFTAAVAVSCLVSPAPGDKALICRIDGLVYVLAILERPPAQGTTLSFPGDLRINAPNGRVEIAGSEATLRAAKKTRLISRDLRLTAENSSLHAVSFRGQTRDVEWRTGRAAVLAKTLDTMAERVVQSAKTVVRLVEEVETLRIGNLVQTVKNILTMNAKNTVMTARKEMTIDGERIHMG